MAESNTLKNHGITNLHEEILNQLPTTVMAVDSDMNIIFINTAGEKILNMRIKDMLGKKCSDVFKTEHCENGNCRMLESIKTGQPKTAVSSIEVNGFTIPIEYYTAPIKNKNDEIVGGLEYVVDISERVKKEKRLKEQARTIREISTPAIKLWEGILVLPVIGVVDSARSQQMMENMLQKIVESSAKVMILDISGVAALDTAVANHLIRITKATKLMGCTSIISGVSPAVAQTIVTLGIKMEDIRTKSTLNDALMEAFYEINLEVVKQENRTVKNYG